jgi:hypothetical protein
LGPLSKLTVIVAWPLPGGAVLGMFAKRPDAGRVKTRLASVLGEEFAAEHADLAASVQARLEEVLLQLAWRLHEQTQQTHPTIHRDQRKLSDMHPSEFSPQPLEFAIIQRTHIASGIGKYPSAIFWTDARDRSNASLPDALTMKNRLARPPRSGVDSPDSDRMNPFCSKRSRVM